MDRHDKHLIVIFILVILGMIGSWIHISESHDVLIFCLGGLMMEMHGTEKE